MRGLRPSTPNILVLVAALSLAGGPCRAEAAGDAGEEIDFSRDIQPILSEHCFHCHGPDPHTREADLRLDQRQTYLSGEGDSIVVAGDPTHSELFLRISTDEDDLRMPPTDTGKRLSPGEIEAIRRWIAAGASWRQHWAFTRPVAVSVPQVKAADPVRNPIDAFVLRRLREHQLQPSPEADPETLIRRVSLDLTGLPPTPAEVDRYLADDRDDAYERLVDRLLASPRYGEQMAAAWLDAARFADTYGYQDDGETSMWRWRDWVIDAFNRNLPYDQFTLEQMAGDLLPDATFEQRIATAFHRNHRHNSEGGAIPEEFRVEYVVDRISTLGTVWLGLTLGCARCHDHKYDPITQREFYELFAFFNSVPEDGRARKEGNTPPLMQAPTELQLATQHALEQQLQAARQRDLADEPHFSAAMEAWERTADPNALPPPRGIAGKLKIDLPLDGNLALASGDEPDGVSPDGPPRFTNGVRGQALELGGDQRVVLSDIGGFSSDSRVTLTAWIRPTASDGAILSKLQYTDDPQSEGYSLLLGDGHLRVYLTAQWQDDGIRLQTQTRVPLNQWTHLAVTYDGLQLASGIRVYFDGQLQPTEVEFDSLYQGFANEGPLTLGAAGDPSRQFHGQLDDVRIYDVELSPGEIARLSVGTTIAQILRTKREERTAREQEKLRNYYTDHFAASRFRQTAQEVDRLQHELAEHRRGYPTLMILQELPSPRPTYVLGRGQYDAPGAEVTPGVPAVFADLPEGAPRNRLGLARWLVDPNNPLTARVAVNRLWQMSFDRGLVRTAEDFGVQGEAPSHPELLDWLANQLVEQHWDLQAIRRLIVTSATYRQQSHVTEDLLEADPHNRLLARGPRFRLPAEVIRDAALYASGLLVEQLGGPSVKPYQPEGLWEELSDETYEQDRGDKLYRRSMYIFWKRTVTHPLMTALDAPSREVCTVREERTNTPMQALALMNETGMVEAARVLAQRVLSEPLDTSADRLHRAFRLVTARRPSPAEMVLLDRILERHLEHFTANPQAAGRLANVGESPTNPHLDTLQVAAYTAVTSMLMNLDEVVTQH
jgi:hypothetical protein